ncbi:MAG: lysophospholipid acyltransferase family protein [Patescibacteria group bacterium]
MSIEKFGQFLGKTIGKKGVEYLKNKIDNFDIKISGANNLEELKEEVYLLVANHLKPGEKMSENSGVSPDAFVISKAVEQITGQKIKIVQKSDDGWWAKNALQRSFQKNISQPLGRGFSEGFGNVPILKNPGSFNRKFLNSIDDTVKNGDPILIFPEGNWYEDFDLEHEIKPGAAHIAKKYNLKIVPAYINGANSWKENQEVRVSFGEHFSPEEMDKNQVSERIKEEIGQLQVEFNNENSNIN